MDPLNSSEGRWAVSLCKCTEGMIHFTYGNATLHVAVEDVAALGTALERLAAALAAESAGEKKARPLH